MRLLLITLLTLSLLLCCTGCFVVRVDNPVSAEPPQEQRHHFYLFGRIGETEINLNEKCPGGVASFTDKFTLGDVFFSFITLGIYTPRTVEIRCASTRK